MMAKMAAGSAVNKQSSISIYYGTMENREQAHPILTETGYVPTTHPHTHARVQKTTSKIQKYMHRATIIVAHYFDAYACTAALLG